MTRLLFHQTTTPTLRDFSFNDRTEKALRHTLDKLKKDYLDKPDDAKAKDSPAKERQATPSTQKGKRRSNATATTGSAAKKAKTEAQVEGDDSGAGGSNAKKAGRSNAKKAGAHPAMAGLELSEVDGFVALKRQAGAMQQIKPEPEDYEEA
jgi:hypothetical protein